MRGFVGGMIVGTAIVAVVGAGMSLMSPLPQRPIVNGDGPQTGTETEAPTDSGPVANLGTDGDLVELAPVGPGAQDSEHETLTALDDADTQPGDKPSVGPATGALDGPGDQPQSGSVSVGADTPVSARDQAGLPQSPQEEQTPTAATDTPAQPALPDLGDSDTGFGSQTSDTETAPSVRETDDPAPDTTEPTAVAEETAPEAAPQPSTESSVTAGNEAPVVTPDSEGADAPKLAALPQAGSGADSSTSPTVGNRVVPLTERNKPEAEPETAEVVVSGDATPLETYAASFENTEDKPLMAIVLIDDDMALGGEALRDFPYPLSFAVDPAAPDAAEKMARYRAAGQEVVAMLNMPGASTAQDAEVSLSVWLDVMPETVALLEGTGSGIQGNREMAEQVSAIAGSTGRGLITQDNGLNTVQKLAARNGVPSAVVFRDFDGAGQTPTVMRRFLDQAAFRARQEGAVVMLGRVRPDTISALLLWGLQDRANRVTLAPVSAVLTQQ
ncbi:divergent polysaccharide deacetylase family protein [Primorskyibacter sp. S87]|uniref:divergent polysaccharide deacetylase family protein n=1 Tax=Primorskyibacter sp. S87 TaxID=3415126 RepID=UPI003C7D16F8